LIDDVQLLLISGEGDVLAGLWSSHPLILLLAQRAMPTIL
jgi:hypothetical protein